jgi:hypothetical protein
MPLLLSAFRNQGLVINEITEPFAMRSDGLSFDEHHEVMETGTKLRVICDTEMKGYETVGGASPDELVINAPQGFIPLWDTDVTLRWRFRRSTLAQFADPVVAGARIEQLFSKAIALWGDGAPVKFKLDEDVWDFEVVVRELPQCTVAGCVLASAFFPDAGQHELFIYPTIFEQPEQEQIETLAHEVGHIFGLRHFFALVKEAGAPAVIWGKQDPFSIMNYGPKSVMTEADRSDLKSLYELVWTGELTEIAGSKITLVRPFHEAGKTNG